VRKFITKALGSDDYCAFGAAISLTALVITSYYGFREGLGQHTQNLTFEQNQILKKPMWLTQLFYFTTLPFIKCSILCFYRRLVTSPRHVLFLNTLMVIIVCYGIASSIVSTAMCIPLKIIWSPQFPRGCIDVIRFNDWNAAFSITTDFILAAAPIPIVKGLQMSRRRMVGLVIVFSLGILAIVGTIARVVVVALALTAIDYPWYMGIVVLCSSIETSTAIMFSCAPSLRPLLRYALPGSSKGDSASYNRKDSRSRSRSRRNKNDRETRSEEDAVRLRPNDEYFGYRANITTPLEGIMTVGWDEESQTAHSTKGSIELGGITKTVEYGIRDIEVPTESVRSESSK